MGLFSHWIITILCNDTAFLQKKSTGFYRYLFSQKGSIIDVWWSVVEKFQVRCNFTVIFNWIWKNSLILKYRRILVNVIQSELFWSVLSCIWTECGDLHCKSPYSIQMRDIDQKNLEYGHFSGSANGRHRVMKAQNASRELSGKK